MSIALDAASPEPVMGAPRLVLQEGRGRPAPAVSEHPDLALGMAGFQVAVSEKDPEEGPQ
ncbi:MAG TPA: hypothetical protein VFB37_10675 [Steroidobacteraceae bacterium]|nr:hypothetical protein [Steroidobacteraceae bacterium]